MNLHEKHRPRKWADVVGQERALKCLLGMRDRCGLGGKAYWIAGPSGTGKTTLARLIAGELADEWGTDELDASGLTDAAIRDIERNSQTRGMGEKSGRAYIVNEAHGLTRAAIRQLLTTLERIPGHVVWVFTTIDDGQEKILDGPDGRAFLSRCTSVPMDRRGLAEPMAERTLEIARAEGLDGGKTVKQVLEHAKRYRNNFRALLQFVESGGLLAGAELAVA